MHEFAIGTKRTSRGSAAMSDCTSELNRVIWVTLAIKRYREANKMADSRTDIFYGAATIIAGVIVLLS